MFNLSLYVCIVMMILYTGMEACSGTPERPVENQRTVKLQSVADLPVPVRAVVDSLTAGGVITRIEKETAGGTVLYDVEATVFQTHVEYDIDAQGRILSRGEGVPFTALPPAVRAAAEAYFDPAQELNAFREVEKGQVFFEVDGVRSGIRTEVKFTDTGDRVTDTGDRVDETP